MADDSRPKYSFTIHFPVPGKLFAVVKLFRTRGRRARKKASKSSDDQAQDSDQIRSESAQGPSSAMTVVHQEGVSYFNGAHDFTITGSNTFSTQYHHHHHHHYHYPQTPLMKPGLITGLTFYDVVHHKEYTISIDHAKSLHLFRQAVSLFFQGSDSSQQQKFLSDAAWYGFYANDGDDDSQRVWVPTEPKWSEKVQAGTKIQMTFGLGRSISQWTSSYEAFCAEWDKSVAVWKNRKD